MTEINLKEQAVKGATVHFRCGGSAVVAYTACTEHAIVRITFQSYDGGVSWFNDGGCYEGEVTTLFDIVRIDPPALD